MAGKQTGGCDMCGVSGIDFYVCHSRHDRCQYHIPVFGRVFVYTDFHRFKHIDLCGKRQQGFGKFLCDRAAFFR